jgi:hypothetical protein
VLVDKDTLKQLTGTPRPKGQMEWLKKRGWKFDTNALGKVVVSVSEFNRHMVGGRAVSSQTPDWSAVNG